MIERWHIASMDAYTPELKEEVAALIARAMNGFDPKAIEPSIAALEAAWALLPVPKEECDDSFLVAKYITHVYFNAGRFDDALPWALQFTKSFTKRSYGESEFMLAKVYVELGRDDEAPGLFAIAGTKSFDGKVSRVWKGEKNPRYLAFFEGTPEGAAAAKLKHFPRRR